MFTLMEQLENRRMMNAVAPINLVTRIEVQQETVAVSTTAGTALERVDRPNFPTTRPADQSRLMQLQNEQGNSNNSAIASVLRNLRQLREIGLGARAAL